MTTDADPANLSLNQSDEIAGLALLTADVLESVVDAALTGNRDSAFRVVCRAEALARARARSDRAVRQLMQSCSGRTLRYTAGRLQVVSDLGRIAALVLALARHLAANDVPAPVLDTLGTELATVGTAGAERLRCLAAGLQGPGMDADYVRCGCALRTAAERLTSGRSDQGLERPATRVRAVTACAALAEAVLITSRHAARAA